jgi:hypothetical protein
LSISGFARDFRFLLGLSFALVLVLAEASLGCATEEVFEVVGEVGEVGEVGW